MNTRAETTGPTARTAEEAIQRSSGRRLRDVLSAFRQIFGMPDYDRYLEHAAAAHPGAPVLTRREYCAQMIDRKYGKTAGRCC